MTHRPSRAATPRLALMSALLVACTACGGTVQAQPPAPGAEPPAAQPPSGDDVAEGQPLVGPLASWDDICGPAERMPQGATAERRARCIRGPVTELDAAGPFEAMATFHQGMGSPVQLALRTARGWFVTAMPGDRAPYPLLSHHTPRSESYDPTATRFERGALKLVLRGSSSSFIPGRGARGSSSRRWTSVRACTLRGGVPICEAPRQVWSRSCQRAMDGPGESCSETGTDR